MATGPLMRKTHIEDHKSTRREGSLRRYAGLKAFLKFRISSHLPALLQQMRRACHIHIQGCIVSSHSVAPLQFDGGDVVFVKEIVVADSATPHILNHEEK